MDGRESEEIAHLMSIGFLADRLLVALDLHEPERLASAEPELAADLTLFLGAVKQLAERPAALLSRQPTSFAFPAAEYVGLELISAGLDERERESLLRYVEELQDIVGMIKTGKAPSPSQLQTLRLFLERLAAMSLEQVDDRRMKAEAGTTEPRSLIEWSKTYKS